MIYIQMAQALKILHTSDWHLGRMLYGQKRYDEFRAFLNWLVDTIILEQIDILLVAGDIFDTTTPSNLSQELYYDFLTKIAKSGCQHVVIIAGNHDSPSFLNAPKQLLRALNVHVVSSVSTNLEDEVLVLKKGDKPLAIVCAVPYLRDKDLRSIEAGESIDDKHVKMMTGIKQHYQAVCDIALEKQSLPAFNNTPIIAMGHLFTNGGQTIDGDGVRELYVGTLLHVGKDIFPKCIDYLALGHLHIHQKVGQCDHMRFSGSPIPMGFGEARQEKRVIIVSFLNKEPEIIEKTIPCFQELLPIHGSFEEICSTLTQKKEEKSSAWLEINITKPTSMSDLRERLDEIISHSDMHILRIKYQPAINHVLSIEHIEDALDNLNPDDVFKRCLDAFNIPDDERQELIKSHQEIIHHIHQQDTNQD